MTDKQNAEMQEDLEKLIGTGDEQLPITTNEVEIIVNKIKFLNEYNSYLGKTKQFMLSFNQDIFEKPLIPNDELMKLRLSLILEELCELAVGCGRKIEDEFKLMLNNRAARISYKTQDKKPNLVEIIDAFGDLQYVLSGGIHSFGMGNIFDTAFEEIHESNMTKLCISKEEAEETVKFYKEKEVETIIKPIPSQGYWIVLRKTDNKVLKSVNYKPAQLMEIIEKS